MRAAAATRDLTPDMTTIATPRSALRAPVTGLPLPRLHLWACNAVFVAFFLSIWKYKTWFVVAGGAAVLSAFIVVLGGMHIRGLLRDLWPLALFFAYLIAASRQSAYPQDALYWSTIDSVGVLVASLFWLAARNNEPASFRIGFIYVSLIAAVVVLLIARANPWMSRPGSYVLPFYPVALPFLWAEINSGKRKRLAWIALAVVLSILLLSNSRAPLGISLLVLGLAFLWMGRSVAQRVRLGLLMTILVIVVSIALMSFSRTRFLMLTFAARITHEDIITRDHYVPGEPVDPTRDNLEAIVKRGFWDAQPFGIGYMTTPHLYEREWGYPTILHSMYQTWAFEGGILCVLIMAGVLIRHLRAMRRVRRIAFGRDEDVMARCLMLSTMAVMLMGLFHQMNQGPIFYAVLGMALGLRERVCVAYGVRR